MLPVIAEPRKELSKYAPRIVTTKIPVEKIKDVIGTGGKVINKIIEAAGGVKIDIEEDGNICIYSVEGQDAEKALKMIEEITREIEAGQIYEGTVTRIATFGAFVDLGGGKEGLLHISKISSKRVDKVEDVLAVGDEITVKVIEIDNQGRINLSTKDLEVANTQNVEE